ncbi:MAG: methyltransferase domain-containing protein [Bdellovibrionales bacterium]|nr:methyltransferase domain-containing protein [Bdellovibrionales bacterium]
MDDFQLLMKLHIEDERQGPGGLAETRRAIEFAGLTTSHSLKIADIGCGTGASTLVLAQELDAKVTAIDLFSEFLEVLNTKAQKAGLKNILTKAISMDSLPFAQEELDVIWSEGAIYNIGFKNGVNLWKPYLKQGGVLAVSEITWLTNHRPKDIDDYWSAAYPEIATASEKIRILEESGFKLLGYFPLPISCWSENYYAPLQSRFSSFLEQQGNSKEALQLIEMEKNEIELYEKFKDYYSYGFYIAAKI